MKRVIVISQSFPPQVGGSAVLMKNIFQHFPIGSCIVLSGPKGVKTIDQTEKLSIPIYSITYPPSWHGFIYRYEFILTPLIILKGLQLIKKNQIDSIFVNYPSISFLLGGYYLSKLTKLPFDTYMHDLWQENMSSVQEKFLANNFEARIFHSSRRVYAITETAAEYLANKHKRIIEILPHPVDLSKMSKTPEYTESNQYTILFTGYIYQLMNLDTIQSLVEALTNWDRAVKLLLVTTIEKKTLERWGIQGNAIEIKGSLSRSETYLLQKQSSILYLPLSFNSYSPLEVKTVFPVKATDYLASGRPILVHAPSNSYSALYAQKSGWGAVLSSKKISDIRFMIERLLDDQQYRSQLISAARMCAEERDSRLISQRLQDQLLK